MSAVKKQDMLIDQERAFDTYPHARIYNGAFRVIVQGLSGNVIPPVLAKFTKRQFAPRVCGSLSIITPTYYRDGPNCGENPKSNNMSDPREGMAAFDCTDREVTLVLPAKGNIRERSITAELKSFETEQSEAWIVSMSKAQKSFSKETGIVYAHRRVYQHFRKQGLDAVSFILDFPAIADEFCFRLGAEFGEFCRHNMESVYEKMYNREILEKSQNEIVVQHGPVMYTDHKGEFLLRYSQEDGTRSTMSLFLKDSKFSVEQEYRFLLTTWGKPRSNQVILPITETLEAFFTDPYQNSASGESERSPRQKMNSPKGSEDLGARRH